MSDRFPGETAVCGYFCADFLFVPVTFTELLLCGDRSLGSLDRPPNSYFAVETLRDWGGRDSCVVCLLGLASFSPLPNPEVVRLDEKQGRSCPLRGIEGFSEFR